jgi:osmotically-inducible protein OsmY
MYGCVPPLAWSMLPSAAEDAMFRALLRLVLVVVIVAAAAAFFLGYRLGGDGVETPVSAEVPAVDADKARATGAAIGEKVATGAAHAEQALNEGSLTAKIKAKMALDDTVKALAIDVDTNGSVVTLTGAVHSEAERAKAVQLARDTDGVTSVNDKLVVR